MTLSRRYAFKKRKWLFLAESLDDVGYFFHKPKPSDKLTPTRILVVRLDQLGDIIQTFPFIESLHAAFPNARIDVLTTSAGAVLYRRAFDFLSFIEWECPWFDGSRTPNFSTSQVRSMIRSNAYDAAFDLRGDIRLIWLMRRAGVQNLVGYGATGGGFLLDIEAPWDANQHAIDKNLKLLEAAGIPVTSRVPRMKADMKSFSSKKRLAVHPDAGTTAKKWPPSYFSKAISQVLKKNDCDVVLIGLKTDIGDQIEKELGGRVQNKMGKTSLPELISILAGCDGLLSNDSGPAHLMAALGKPVWVLWSGTAPSSVWAPRGPKVELFEHPVPCAPCSLSMCPVPGHPCLENIKPQDVANAIGL